eukprot:SAG11_NODE_413_length_9694_cov_2.695675_9_plen_57_part_00
MLVSIRAHILDLVHLIISSIDVVVKLVDAACDTAGNIVDHGEVVKSSKSRDRSPPE